MRLRFNDVTDVVHLRPDGRPIRVTSMLGANSGAIGGRQPALLWLAPTAAGGGQCRMVEQYWGYGPAGLTQSLVWTNWSVWP